MDNIAAPYVGLMPDLILNAIDSVGFSTSGSLHALNSYENRVYQVGIEEAEPLIAKFYRPYRWSNEAILEEHEFALELVKHEIPVVAPLLSQKQQTLMEYAGFRFALFPRKGGRALELENLSQLTWMGRFIGRLHAVGACRPFQQRRRLDTQTYGVAAANFLLDHNFIPTALRNNYCQVIEELLAEIDNCFQKFGTVNYIRLHGDCHAGNVLWSDLGPHIVDLDDCLMGPAIQDLWMLLSGNTPAEIQQQLKHILDGYQQFYDFDYRQLHLIEALRSLRMIHYSAWLARRWQDPAFPLNFPWFNTERYWQEQLHNLAEQIELVRGANNSTSFFSE